MTLPPLRCVIDASTGIKLLVAEPLSERADALFSCLAADPGAEFFVPDLFYVECANILWKYVRRMGHAADKARKGLDRLCALALTSVPTQDLAREALDLALHLDISAYDACYVALAQAEQAPLITADERLVRKLAGSPHAVRWLGDCVIPPAP